jgi:hypothetical protein
LRHHRPRVFKQFLTRYHGVSKPQAAHELFRRYFPKYDGMNPLFRPDGRLYGYPDDAQVMDEVLFAELRDGFSEDVSFALCFEKPNVIFTDLCGEDEWPADPTSAAGQHWVVVIDYHE